MSRDNALDRITVRTELSPHLYVDLGSTLEHEAIQRISERVRYELQSVLSLGAKVEINEPYTLPRSEGKAVRVVDQRNA